MSWDPRIRSSTPYMPEASAAQAHPALNSRKLRSTGCLVVWQRQAHLTPQTLLERRKSLPM